MPQPSPLTTRYVTWLENAGVGVPDIATILAGILDGDLSLHYARWQHLSRQGGPQLELAYWIGRSPGTASGTAMNRYRDGTTAGTERWVVFHFHMNVETAWVARVGGRTRVGVQAVRVFHGTESNERAGQAWRVDGTGDGAYRDGFRCPEDALWYVGAETTLPGNQDDRDAEFFNLFQRWGRRLFDEGYLATRGLNLIFTVSPPF